MRSAAREHHPTPARSAYYDARTLLGSRALYSAGLRLSSQHRGYLQATNVAIEPGTSVTGMVTSSLDRNLLSLGPLP
jgi:hypothetical protein